MSQNIMADKRFRVLFDVTDLHIKDLKFVWMNVSPSDLKTVYDLKNYVMRRLNLKQEVQLFLQNGTFLDDEDIDVLRDGDTVKVKYKRPVCKNAQETLQENINSSRERKQDEINISDEDINSKTHEAKAVCSSSDKTIVQKTSHKEKNEKSKPSKDIENDHSNLEDDNQSCKKSNKNKMKSSTRYEIVTDIDLCKTNDSFNLNAESTSQKQNRSNKDSKIILSESEETLVVHSNESTSPKEDELNFEENKPSKDRTDVNLLELNREESIDLSRKRSNDESNINDEVMSSSSKRYKAKDTCSSYITIVQKASKIEKHKQSKPCINIKSDHLSVKEDNQNHKKSNEKENKMKSAEYNHNVTDVHFCNTDNSFNLNAEHSPQNENNKASKIVFSESEENNNESTSSKEDELSLYENKCSDVDSLKLSRINQSKRKRKRNRKSKKAEVTAVDKCDPNDNLNSFSKNVIGTVNRKQNLYDQIKKKFNLKLFKDNFTDTCVPKEDKLPNIPSEYCPTIVTAAESINCSNPNENLESFSENDDLEILNSSFYEEVEFLSSTSNTDACILKEDKLTDIQAQNYPMPTPAESNCSTQTDYMKSCSENADILENDKNSNLNDDIEILNCCEEVKFHKSTYNTSVIKEDKLTDIQAQNYPMPTLAQSDCSSPIDSPKSYSENADILEKENNCNLNDDIEMLNYCEEVELPESTYNTSVLKEDKLTDIQAQNYLMPTLAQSNCSSQIDSPKSYSENADILEKEMNCSPIDSPKSYSENAYIFENEKNCSPIDSPKSYSENADILENNCNFNDDIEMLNYCEEDEDLRSTNNKEDQWTNIQRQNYTMSTPCQSAENSSVPALLHSIVPNDFSNSLNDSILYDEYEELSYKDFPAITSLPAVGVCIAYKVMELGANYSPFLSNYREGVIENVTPETNEVEIKLSKEVIIPGKLGKFENIRRNEVPEPVIKTHDVLKWSCVFSPKLLGYSHE